MPARAGVVLRETRTLRGRPGEAADSAEAGLEHQGLGPVCAEPLPGHAELARVPPSGKIGKIQVFPKPGGTAPPVPSQPP